MNSIFKLPSHNFHRVVTSGARFSVFTPRGQVLKVIMRNCDYYFINTLPSIWFYYEIEHEKLAPSIEMVFEMVRCLGELVHYFRTSPKKILEVEHLYSCTDAQIHLPEWTNARTVKYLNFLSLNPFP